MSERDWKGAFWAVVVLLVVSLAAFVWQSSRLATCQKESAQLIQLQAERDTWKDAALKLSDSTKEVAAQRDQWKAAALAEYQALQRVQSGQTVDWGAVLKAVSVLLK
jgi:biopolymer transport protein ExbB/TolQ